MKSFQTNLGQDEVECQDISRLCGSNYVALWVCEATEMFVGGKTSSIVFPLTDPLQRGGEDGVGPPGLPPAPGHPGDPVRP